MTGVPVTTYFEQMHPGPGFPAALIIHELSPAQKIHSLIDNPVLYNRAQIVGNDYIENVSIMIEPVQLLRFLLIGFFRDDEVHINLF